MSRDFSFSTNGQTAVQPRAPYTSTLSHLHRYQKVEDIHRARLPFSLLKPVYSDLYLVLILITLLIVAPRAFLTMAASFYKKQLKLQAYVATILFSWAATTQLFFIPARLLDYYFTFRRFV
jgi:hypothetical protein